MLSIATFSIWGQNQARQGAPKDASRMKKSVQDSLWKEACRPIEPLSAQMASKTAEMMPNGTKKAPQMCQNCIQKGKQIVSKLMIARITRALILQTLHI